MAKILEMTSYASFIVYRIEAMNKLKTPKRLIKEFVELQKWMGSFPKELDYVTSFYDENTGSSGSCFKYKEEEKYIISYTGTNFYFDRDKDLYTDIVSICLGQGEHYAPCYKFYRKIAKNYGENIVLTGHSLGGNIAQRVALEYDVQEVIVYNAAPIYLKDGLNLFMDKEKDVQLYEERIAKYKRNIKKIEKKRNAYTGNVKRIVAENDIFTRISELLHIGYYIGEELIIKDAGLHGIKSFLGNHQETLKDLIVENKGSDQLSDNYKEITLAEINLFKIFSTDNIAYLEEQITSLIMSKRVMDSLNKNNYKVDFKIFLTKLLAAIEETKQNDNIAIQKDELKD